MQFFFVGLFVSKHCAWRALLLISFFFSSSSSSYFFFLFIATDCGGGSLFARKLDRVSASKLRIRKRVFPNMVSESQIPARGMIETK